LALGQKCERLVGMDELKVVNSTIGSIRCEFVVGDSLEHGLSGTKSMFWILKTQAGLDFVVKSDGETLRAEDSLDRSDRILGVEIVGRGLLDRFPILTKSAKTGVS